MRTKNVKKGLIMDSLDKMGFTLELQKYSRETYFHMKSVGILNIYIVLSNKARVVIETSGSGSGKYFITLDKTEYKFSEATTKKLLRKFKSYIKACEEFNKILN